MDDQVQQSVEAKMNAHVWLKSEAVSISESIRRLQGEGSLQAFELREMVENIQSLIGLISNTTNITESQQAVLDELFHTSSEEVRQKICCAALKATDEEILNAVLSVT